MSGYFYITCKKDGKVLDCKGKGKPAAQTALTKREKEEGRETQLWKWDSEGSLINKADASLVAHIKGSRKEAGTPVILFRPTGEPNQKWMVRLGLIHSELNDLVLDASDSYVKTNRPKKSQHQTWEFIPEEIQYFYIISEKDEKVLDSANNVNGEVLATSSRNGEDTQLWRWDGNRLINKLGLVVDIKGKNKAVTTSVILSSPTRDLSQQWKNEDGQLRSMLSNLVMEARDNAIEMHYSLKNSSQKWKIVPDKDLKSALHYFYIVSELDGKVLDSNRDTLEEELIISPKSGRDTQLWRWDSCGSKLVNKLGLVANIKMTKEATSSVILALPTGTLNQKWQQESGYIRSELNGLVMEIWSSQITMEIPSDKQTQKWKFISEEDLNKYFYLLNGEDGKALDSTSDEEGNQLITSEFLRHSSQMWKWDSEGRIISKSGFVVDIKEQSQEAGDQWSCRYLSMRRIRSGKKTTNTLRVNTTI